MTLDTPAPESIAEQAISPPAGRVRRFARPALGLLLPLALAGQIAFYGIYANAIG